MKRLLPLLLVLGCSKPCETDEECEAEPLDSCDDFFLARFASDEP